jgi:RND family efflux transporter MFP subunit
MMMRAVPRALGLLALAALIGPLAFSAGPAEAQGGPAPVGVDEVIREPLSQTVPVLGRLVAVQRGTVAALTRGPVLEVHVDVGDTVQEGDVLITQAMDRLESSRNVAQEAVDAAIASVQTAQSQLELAQQELARLEKLRGSAAFSAAARDDKAFQVAVRRAQVGEARARVAEARAVLAEAQLDVDLGVVRAPFNGVVLERHTVRGAYLTIGDSTITLINDEELEVEADVPAPRVAGLEPGREVGLRLGEQRMHNALVRAVLPEENALTRTRLVRFVPNFAADTSVRPAAGQSVTLEIPVGETREVVTVHKDAILARGPQSSVFVVGSDSTVAPRPVELGEAVGPRFVVLEGLQPGDLVVVRGNERLRPGQTVSWPGQPPAEGNAPSEPGATEEDAGGEEGRGGEAARTGGSG